MGRNLETKVNPLCGIDASFRSYVHRRQRAADAHMDGNGLPDYAFASDYELRKKLDSIPHFYELSKKVVATYASRQMQIINQQALAVGPNQFPEVYAIGRDCAKRLGIGIPNIYIVSGQELNAMTVDVDDVEPLIIIYSALYERLTPGELRVVIGHECGHIHNMHGVYNAMEQILLTGGANALAIGGVSINLLNTVLQGASYALNAWSRAKEVTCDRAGMICCERLEDTYSAEAKLLYGATFGEQDVNIDEIVKQLDMQQNNITRLEELTRTHPAAARRIVAERYFAECDVLYRWRPDLRRPGQTMRSKEETDDLCKRYINILKE